MIHVSSEKTILNELIAPPPSSPTNSTYPKEAPFIGFSEMDNLLAELLRAEIYDQEGEVVNEKLTSYSFKPLSIDHPIYQYIYKMIGLDSLFSISHQPFTIIHLFTDLINCNNNKVRSISDVQIIGSFLYTLLIEHENLLENSTREIFEELIQPELLAKLIEALKRLKEELKADSYNKIYSLDVDYRALCKGPLDFLKELTVQARTILKNSHPDNWKELITNYTIINAYTTLIGFNLLIPFDIVFTTKPTNLSTDTCLSASILHMIQGNISNIEINCAPFSAAKVILDCACGVYTPQDLHNPQALVRLMYNSKRIPMGSKEKEMAECLFKPLEKVSSASEFIEALQKLNYKSAKINTLLTKGGHFQSKKEEWQVRYLYGLLYFKIRSKQLHAERPELTDNVNSSFVFRFCQCLQTHTNFSDEAIRQIWILMHQENLLNFQNTHPLLRQFIHAIITEEIPFSVISSLLVMMGWLYHPTGFTQRLAPPIFFISHPFVMRIPAQLPAALQILLNYLSSAKCNIKILQNIFAFFPKKSLDDISCYQILRQELQLPESTLIEQAKELLNHADPFISFLGMQLILTCPDDHYLPLILSQLPKLLKIQPGIFEAPFNDLYQRIAKRYRLDLSQSPKALSLIEWIKVLCKNREPTIIHLAYKLWIEHAQNSAPTLDLLFLEAFCTCDPDSAIAFLNIIYWQSPKDRFSPQEVCDMFKRVVCSAKMLHRPFNLDKLCPLITDWFSKAPFLEVSPPTFSEILVFYIKSILQAVENERLSLLLTKAVLKGYLPVYLEFDLQKYLYPHLPYLLQNSDLQGYLVLPQQKKEAIFSHLNSYPIQLPYDVLNAWIEILAGIFYPAFFKNQADNFRLNLVESLHIINDYLKTENCNLKALHEIHEALHPHEHTPNHTELCATLKVEEMILIQETFSLLEHADPIISSVGLQTGMVIPSWRNPILFLIQLPKLLKNSLAHIEALKVLFKRIADHYKISLSDLDPLSLNDWIKLISQTQEPDLIALALNIWQEHRAALSSDLDLILFKTLCSTNPPAALHHFHELHATRRPRFSSAQIMAGFVMIVRSYQTKNYPGRLKKLYPLLEELLKDPAFSLEPKQKKPFSDALQFFVERQNFHPQAALLLLKAMVRQGFTIDKNLAEKYIENFRLMKKLSWQFLDKEQEIFQRIRIEIGELLFKAQDKRSYLLVEEILEESIHMRVRDIFYPFLLSYLQQLIVEIPLDAKHPQRLNKLRTIAPFARKQESLDFEANFYNRILEQDFSQASESDLNHADNILINHLNNRHIQSRLLDYIAATPPTATRLPNLWKLCGSLIKESSFTFPPFLRALSGLLEHNFPKPLPDSIQRFIANRPQRLVTALETAQEWKTAQIYLCAFKFYHISFPSLIAQSWNVCVGLTADPKLSISLLVSILETQAPHTWSNHFSSVRNKDSFKKDMQAILNRLASELDYQELNLKWLIFLMNYHLKHFPSELCLSIPGEQFKELTKQVLADQSSLQTKKYLLLNNSLPPEQKPLELAKAEIDRQIQSVQRDFLYWLGLIRVYYPQSIADRLLLWQNLDQCKMPMVIDQAIEDLQTSTLEFGEALLNCWIEALQSLRRLEHEKIWIFIDQLPKIFETFVEHKKLANQILIEGCALNILAQIISGSSNHRKAKSRRDVQNEKYKKLLKKIDDVKAISFETFFLVLASFTNDFIIENLAECVQLTKQVFESNSVESLPIKNKFRALFDNNFNLLITKEFSKRSANQISPIEFCLEQILNSITVDFATLNRVLFFYYQRCQLNPQNHDIQKARSDFFTVYKNFSPAFIDQTEEFKIILYQALSILNDIFSDNNSTVDNQTPPIIANTHLKLSEAIELIFPENLRNYPECYLDWIFSHISTFPQTQDHLFYLKEILLLEVSTKLNIKTNPADIGHLVKLIQNAAQGETDRLYALTCDNDLVDLNYHSKLKDQFLKTFDLFLPLKNHEVFQQKEWLFNILYLLGIANINKLEESCGLFLTSDHQYFAVIIRKLLSYKSFISFSYATILFSNRMMFNQMIKQKERLELFNILLESNSKYFLINFQGSSLLHYLDFNFQPYQAEYLSRLQVGSTWENYGNIMLENKFKTVLHYVKELQKKTNEYSYWQAHYIFCSLMYLNEQKSLGFFKGRYPAYLGKIKLLMDYVIDVERLFVRDKIDPNPPIELPEPTVLATQLSALLVEIPGETDPHASLIEKQHLAIIDWISRLQKLKKANTDPTIREKVNQVLIAAVNQIACFRLDSPGFDKNRGICQQVLDELQTEPLTDEQQIYLGILNFHLESLVLKTEPTKFAKEFLCCCELLKHLFPNLMHLKNLYPILAEKTLSVLTQNPTQPDYQQCWNAFLEISFKYFKLFSIEHTSTSQEMLLNTVHHSLACELFDTSNLATIDKWNKIREWVNESEDLRLYAKLCDLMIIAPNTNENELVLELTAFIPPFAKWLKKQTQQEGKISSLISLLKYAPGNEPPLKTLWDLCFNNNVKILT